MTPATSMTMLRKWAIICSTPRLAVLTKAQNACRGLLPIAIPLLLHAKAGRLTAVASSQRIRARAGDRRNERQEGREPMRPRCAICSATGRPKAGSAARRKAEQEGHAEDHESGSVEA